jgi:hypothetical protein
VPVCAQEGGQLTDREYMFSFKGERRLLTSMLTIFKKNMPSAMIWKFCEIFIRVK